MPLLNSDSTSELSVELSSSSVEVVSSSESTSVDVSSSDSCVGILVCFCLLRRLAGTTAGTAGGFLATALPESESEDSDSDSESSSSS